LGVVKVHLLEDALGLLALGGKYLIDQGLVGLEGGLGGAEGVGVVLDGHLGAEEVVFGGNGVAVVLVEGEGRLACAHSKFILYGRN
jgi:hypothetical protein